MQLILGLNMSNMLLFSFFFCVVTAQIGNTQSELIKLAEQNPELKDAYIAKQKRLKVSYSNYRRAKSLIFQFAVEEDCVHITFCVTVMQKHRE